MSEGVVEVCFKRMDGHRRVVEELVDAGVWQGRSILSVVGTD